MTIGAWSIPSRIGHLESNIQQIQDTAEEAKASGIEFLLLPEACITGYTSTPVAEGRRYIATIFEHHPDPGPAPSQL